MHQSKLGLHPVPLKNVAGLLFVALGDDPVNFDRVAAEVGEKMQHQGLEDAKLAKSVRYTVKANWKLIFENNRECYHCTTRIPNTCRAPTTRCGSRRRTCPRWSGRKLAGERFARMGLGDAMASSEMTGAYWRAARTPLVEGWKTQSLDGQPVAPLMGTFRARNEWSDGTLRSTIFPNFWQHASDDHAVSTRITPIDALTCQVDVYWFVHKDAVEGRTTSSSG